MIPPNGVRAGELTSGLLFDSFRNMEAMAALERLGALAQETRLALFRRLVQQGPEGLAAGEIGAALAVPAPTLSFHLAQLERAGLVLSRRQGRSIRYAANYGAMEELLAYLYDNCCQGGACCPPAGIPQLPTAVPTGTRKGKATK
jgi:ArsR family transcriptional regulator, arsenate/arsenite/antimonite-responsive transcriptional repressor